MKKYKLIRNKIINTQNNKIIAKHENNCIIVYDNDFSKNKIKNIFKFINGNETNLLEKYIYNYLFELYSKKINIEKIKKKTKFMVEKILKHNNTSYKNIIENKDTSDTDKGLYLLHFFYNSIENYNIEPDEMDELKYKFEYYLYKYLSSLRKKTKVNVEKIRLVMKFSAEIKKYSEIFNKEDFKFRHLEEFEKIIYNKENSNEKKGKLILNLIQDSSVENIELKMMKHTQVSKDGKFACLTPCKWKYSKSDSIKYYYPSNRCQCETDDGIKECNKSNCA